MKKFLVLEIGCIECGVDTQIAGLFDNEKDAKALAETLPTWRDGGQSYPQIFEIEV